MPESEQDRSRRASDLAYAQGKRDADIDSRIDSHEKRLDAINGSIEKHARNAAALRASMDELGEKIDGVSAQLVTRAAVEADRVAQIKEANEKQISRKDMWLGVATICAMVLMGLYAKSKGVG